MKYGQRLVDEAVAAQIEAATQAQTYTDQIADLNGSAHGPALIPGAFAGVQRDGRELAPALYGAVTTTKTATRTLGADRAFEFGASYLATVLGTAIQDMGRSADMVGAGAKSWTRYVRVLSPGACSRCAVLAGKASFRTAFRRHPRCNCTTAPIPTVNGVEQNVPGGFFDSPAAYFESLSREEQNRRFTNAGAEAIRQGADVSRVVNARRGAPGIGYSGHDNVPVKPGTHGTLQRITIGVKSDGSPLQVYATTEGTTARGEFGRSEMRLTSQAVKDGRYRRSTSVRLLPEQIIVMAGDDSDRFIEILRRYGYLD